MRRLRECGYVVVGVAAVILYGYLTYTVLREAFARATWAVAGGTVVGTALVVCLLAAPIGLLFAAFLDVRKRSRPLAWLTATAVVVLGGYFMAFVVGRGTTRAEFRAVVDPWTDGEGGAVLSWAQSIAFFGTVGLGLVVLAVRTMVERRGGTFGRRGFLAVWGSGWTVITAVTLLLASR